MRPDEHKAKDSRRYQQKKKFEGDTTAAEIAEARRRAARARDKGVGMSAIRRRNGELQESEQDIEQRKLLQAKFSRRKITSNADRYKEETEQEARERDAELGIDRETTDLVSMLENTEEGNSTFFKFKDEQTFTNDSVLSSNGAMNSKNMFQLDFNTFEDTLQAYDTKLLLGLDKEDEELAQSALNEHPTVLDKPIVPAFAKNANGYVLFKSQQTTKSSESGEGIYLRNDGSNHRVLSKQEIKKIFDEPSVKEKDDDLDELLALDQKPSTPLPTLPKPGVIKKNPIAKNEDKEVIVDDEAWLDDILN
ncbi:uncharacterized protein BX663DRAFT_74973 [Cokeromyces recurvatus]|uniref:uncharacterized protein n=1 Tax=Cokeromyces recurvatus TaxID=90255 RepID=UPI00221FF65F|nr:uncharacterized protein BX663DRAFT_74973 [Cokeromyces recurvatus]KAI7902421.1 hypothetical protein BX663DRAFT_74973 [Cokeromyces recurvatus]